MKIKSLILAGGLCFQIPTLAVANDMHLGRTISSLENSHMILHINLFESAKKLIETPGIETLITNNDNSSEWLTNKKSKLNALLGLLNLDDSSVFEKNSKTDIAAILRTAEMSDDDIQAVVECHHEIKPEYAQKICSRIKKFSHSIAQYAKTPLSFGSGYISDAIDMISTGKRFNQIQKTILYKKIIDELKPLEVSNYDLETSLNTTEKIGNMFIEQNKQFWQNLDLSRFNGKTSPYVTNWFIDSNIGFITNAQTIEEVNIAAEGYLKETLSIYIDSIAKNPLQKSLSSHSFAKLIEITKSYYQKNDILSFNDLINNNLKYLSKIADTNNSIYQALSTVLNVLKNPDLIIQGLDEDNFHDIIAACKKQYNAIAIRRTILTHIPLDEAELKNEKDLEHCIKELELIK